MEENETKDGSKDNGLKEPPKLTHEEIDKLSDVVEAMLLAEDYGINIDGLDSLSGIQLRLKCHLKLLNGENLKPKYDQQLKALGEKDATKRKTLSEMVKEVSNIFPPDHRDKPNLRQTLMEDLLNKDGTTENIRTDCELRIKSLQEKECVVLVSGESSAGKSSLLNLLLGEEILPSHSLPCTSCITVIKYNSYRCAKVVYKNGELMNIPNLDKAGLEMLQQRAYFSNATKENDKADVYKRRKDGHDVAEIQVYLPLKMLNSGLVLVDTPGIGENEFLENYLMEYIRTNQILGFMYIIMTDNALGVAEDRLLNLMTLIIKSQKSSSDIVKFNPKAALFVCNRWDMVPDESKITVRENVLKQLGKAWPDFDKSNVVFFSTYQALREIQVNEGYVTEEYVALLHGLQKLVDVSLDKRIKASYGWLGTVLQRSVHYLRTMVRTLDLSDRQRQETSKSVTAKLKALEQKAGKVISSLYNEMEVATNDIIHQIRNYLLTTQAKTHLTMNWGRKEGEIPNMEYAAGTWEWVKRHIDEAFDDRLTDLLEEWDEKAKFIPNLEKKLFREAKLNLAELENDIADVENDKNDAHEHRKMSSAMLLTNLCRSIEDFEDEDLFETDIPKKLAHRLKVFMTKKIKKKQEESKLKDFKSDPKKTAEKRAQKLYQSMLKDEDNRLESFVRNFMQRPFNLIRRLENKIPSLIKSNMTLQDKLNNELVEQARNRQHYHDMMVRIEKVRRDLIIYGEDNFCANDFQEEDVKIIDSTVKIPARKGLMKRTSMGDLMVNASSCKDRVASESPHGIWHEVHLGAIQKGSETQHVVVKIYSGQAKIDNMLQEVAKLRCLLHNEVCIAEFLGVYQRKDHPTPALIFSGRLYSVRRYMKMNTEVDGTKMLHEVLIGLQYLHSKGLVHMELTRDTVTVSDRGDVKMTGQCLPRKYHFPEGNSVPSRPDFVFLAPEVLEGQTYFACADMYSFAIFAAEIKTPNFDAVQELRQCSLRGSVGKVSPRSCLEPFIADIPVLPGVKKELLNCIEKNPSARPDAAKMASEFKAKGSMRHNIASPKSIFSRTFSSKRK